ncbi:NrfD/PsrC family molybdoenzyme membrane anchor subunit, partial [Chloroflexota bacterium]
MISQQKQKAFGWLVSFDLFFAAAGAGLFLVSFILNIMNRYEAVARTGALLGPIIVLIGAILLFAELGNKGKVAKLFFSVNLSSWMSRGTWILTIFIALGLAYALPAFQAFRWLPWGNSGAIL